MGPGGAQMKTTQCTKLALGLILTQPVTLLLAQEGDVMNAVQMLRAQARANGRLTSTPQQQVLMQDQAIEIQPTDPEMVYVPSYNPEYIWGAPAYGYYYP